MNHSLFACLIVTFAMIGCEQKPAQTGNVPTTQLTRQLAMEILSKSKLDVNRNSSDKYISLNGAALKDLYDDGLVRIDPDGTGELNKKGADFFNKYGFRQTPIRVRPGTSIPADGASRLVTEKVVEGTGIAMNGDGTQAHVEFNTEWVFADELRPVTKYLNKSAGSHKADMKKYDDGWRAVYLR